MNYYSSSITLLDCSCIACCTLPLRFCAARFASRAPTWRLPVSGHVSRLVTADLGIAEGDGVEDARSEVHWVSGSGPRRTRIRLNRKKPCTPRGFGCSISATCVEEIASCGAFSLFIC